MNLVFDFAGVLFHWRPAELLAAELPGVAITPEQFFEGWGGDWAEFDRGRLDAPQLAMRIAMRTTLSPTQAQRVIEAVPYVLEADAGMVALLEALHAAGRPLFYLSNMPVPYAGVLEERFGVVGLFRHGLVSGRIGLVKPEAAMFERAERAFGLEPARTLFFDDVQANVDAAAARGWQALRWEDAAQCRAELAARGLLA